MVPLEELYKVYTSPIYGIKSDSIFQKFFLMLFRISVIPKLCEVQLKNLKKMSKDKKKTFCFAYTIRETEIVNFYDKVVRSQKSCALKPSCNRIKGVYTIFFVLCLEIILLV